jgi:hypothetical protein
MRTANALPFLGAAALVLGACAGSGTPPPRTAPPVSGDGGPAVRPEPPPPSWRPVREPPVHVDSATGVMFPRRLGGLRFVGVQRYGRPELGYSLRYQNHTNLWIDVYVYDLGHRKIPHGAASATLVRQFRQSSGEILATARRGLYTQLHVGPRSQVTLEGRAFLLGAYHYKFRGAAVRSRLYLTGYRGHYVKVRATWWTALGARGAGTVDQALKDLAGLLQ